MVVAYGLLFGDGPDRQEPEAGPRPPGRRRRSTSSRSRTARSTNESADDQLDQAIEIIRRRVDASGVAEPEVSRQGNTISMQIPGAKDQQEVLEAGRRAPPSSRFRPVLARRWGAPDRQGQEEGGGRGGEAAGRARQFPRASPLPGRQRRAGQAAHDDHHSSSRGRDPSDDRRAGRDHDGAARHHDRSHLRQWRQVGPVQARGQDCGTTTTTVPPTPLNQCGVNVYDTSSASCTSSRASYVDDELARRGPEGRRRGQPSRRRRLGLQARTDAGRPAARSRTPRPASRTASGRSTRCSRPAPTASTSSTPPPPSATPATRSARRTAGEFGRLGIVLDAVVLSAPTIKQANFDPDQIQISGSFTKDEAKALAVVAALRLAAARAEGRSRPRRSRRRWARVRSQAGIIAGIIGLVPGAAPTCSSTTGCSGWRRRKPHHLGVAALGDHGEHRGHRRPLRAWSASWPRSASRSTRARRVLREHQGGRPQRRRAATLGRTSRSPRRTRRSSRRTCRR